MVFESRVPIRIGERLAGRPADDNVGTSCDRFILWKPVRRERLMDITADDMVADILPIRFASPCIVVDGILDVESLILEEWPI